MLNLIEKYKLCNEIKDIIISYLPKSVSLWLTKERYETNHYILQSILNEKRMYDNYLRMIARKDMYYPFEIILQSHDLSLWAKKKYFFSGVKYHNYIHFLDSFMFEYNSCICRDILFTYVYRKKYKKINTSIEWMN
jgi:hypothetical protein